MAYQRHRRPQRYRHYNSDDANVAIDYKDLKRLARSVSETGGKIVARRITGTSARQQRELAAAVKLARFLALLPYADSHR